MSTAPESILLRSVAANFSRSSFLFAEALKPDEELHLMHTWCATNDHGQFGRDPGFSFVCQ